MITTGTTVRQARESHLMRSRHCRWLALRSGANGGSADELKAFVFGEIAEVPRVQRCEWQALGEAARGNPGVVLRSWAATHRRACRDLAPAVRNFITVGKRWPRQEPRVEFSLTRAAPAAHHRPSDQLAQRHERDRHARTDQLAQQVRRQLAFDTQRGDIGVENDPAYASATVAVAQARQVGKELVELVIVENTIVGEVVCGSNRRDGREQFIDRSPVNAVITRYRRATRRHNTHLPPGSTQVLHDRHRIRTTPLPSVMRRRVQNYSFTTAVGRLAHSPGAPSGHENTDVADERRVGLRVPDAADRAW